MPLVDRFERQVRDRGRGPRRPSSPDVAAAIEADAGRKWAGHTIAQVTFLRPGPGMSQIGG